ncbi:MAG: hypothetical protein KY452_02460 [Actinobacteria bacterium]|nr:hypothetical protein [Actinomycetota bacterium]
MADSDQPEEGDEHGQGLRKPLDLVEVGHLGRSAAVLEVEAELLELASLLVAVGARGEPDQHHGVSLRRLQAREPLTGHPDAVVVIVVVEDREVGRPDNPVATGPAVFGR